MASSHKTESRQKYLWPIEWEKKLNRYLKIFNSDQLSTEYCYIVKFEGEGEEKWQHPCKWKKKHLIFLIRMLIYKVESLWIRKSGEKRGMLERTTRKIWREMDKSVRGVQEGVKWYGKGNSSFVLFSALKYLLILLWLKKTEYTFICKTFKIVWYL